MRREKIITYLKQENFPRIEDFIKALFVFLKREQFLLQRGGKIKRKEEIYITKRLQLKIKDTKSTDLK